jgi:hypothetical protein
MKTLLKWLSAAALVLTVAPSVLVFAGVLELRTHYWLMAAGMFLWFATAPFWIRRDTA